MNLNGFFSIDQFHKYYLSIFFSNAYKLITMVNIKESISEQVN